MAPADKRIPVTEETWKELGELKGAGETYDDLLSRLVERERKRQLAEKVREAREDGDFVEVDWGDDDQ